MDNLSNSDLLVTILSIGFVILIVFVCVALSAMIKIMLDIRKITEMARGEMEKIDAIIDVAGNKAKSFFANSFVLEKIFPSIIGAVSMGLGAKKMMDHYDSKTKVTKKDKIRGKKYGKQNIFVEEEID